MAAASGTFVRLDAFLNSYIPRPSDGDLTEESPARHASATMADMYAYPCKDEDAAARKNMFVARAIVFDLVRALARQHGHGEFGAFGGSRIYVTPASGSLTIVSWDEGTECNSDAAHYKHAEQRGCMTEAMDSNDAQTLRRRDMYTCAQLILSIYERFLQPWIPKYVWEWVHSSKQVPEAERFSAFLTKVIGVVNSQCSFDTTILRAARALFTTDDALQALAELASP